MRLLALDPGKTTGAVLLVWPNQHAMPVPSGMLGCWEMDFADMPQWLDERLSEGVDLLVMERFYITTRTVTYTRQPEPMYVIGGALFLASLYNTPVRMQAAADAKTAWPDEALAGWKDALGPVRGGHARDALRHALLAAGSKDVYDLRTRSQTGELDYDPS